MAYRFTRYISSLMTKDLEKVSLCIQSVNEIDSNVLFKIKEDIKCNMDKNQALHGNIQARQIVFSDCKNVTRQFSSCFILTYNSDYSKVIEANIVSFVEVK